MKKSLAAITAVLLAAGSAYAQDTVKLGMVAELSGAGAPAAPRQAPAAAPRPQAIPLWRLLRAPHAWAMAVFFGAQSLQAYVVFGWVPAVLTEAGMTQDRAGGMLAIATAMGIPISAVVPTMLGAFKRHEAFVVAFIGSLALGYTGLTVMPLTASWLTAVLIGAGMGSFPMALTLLALRAHTPEGTTALSGVAQSVGYLIASIGPVGFGLLHDLSGSYTVSLVALAICRRGVRNVLGHLGVLPPTGKTPEARPENILRIPGHDGYVLATTDGVFEPFHALGATVHAGQAAGRIHNLANPAREPETVFYLSDGIVYGRRQPGRVVIGNCCVTVARRYEGELA